MNIAELEEATGQPRRNIRYLIAQGVVPEAESRGRFASYGEKHVKALNAYTELRQRGVSAIDAIREEVTATLEGRAPLRLEPVPGIEISIDVAALADADARTTAEAVATAVRKALADAKNTTPKRKGRSK